MGKYLDEMLFYKAPLSKKTRIRAADGFVFLLLTAFALYARFSMFPFLSGDYTQFLSHWYDALKEAGGIPGIGLSIGDYAPSYIYLLSLLTYLPFSSLVSIKLLSCAFDFLLAIFVMLTVVNQRGSKTFGMAAYGITLFLPTVLFNSAYWAQCDAMFVSFLIICIYFLLKDRPFAAMLCFSVSFCLKLQAIFLLPLLVLLFLKRKIKLRYFLLIPGVYLVSILPAFFAGRPLCELLTIYFDQAGSYSRLSLNAPNLYFFIGEDTTKALSMAAIMLCGSAVLLSLYLLYKSRIRFEGITLVAAGLFFALLLPYLLPHMHERYFFLADILAVIYAFIRPKRFYIPVMVGFASFAGYLPFLFGHQPIDLKFAAILMGIALLIVAYDLFYAVFYGHPEKKVRQW